MEDYNWAMFTHAMNFFQNIHEFEKVDSITFLHKLTKQFVDRRFGNPWQLVINKIHETLKTTICNSK
jgi:hypothetical protein